MIKTHYTIQLKFKVDHLLVNVHELNVFSLNVSLIPIFFINNNDGNGNNNYGYAADIPRGGSSCPLFPSCGIVVLWREENRNTQGEKPLGTTTRTNNKLHSHVTAGPGIKPHP